MQQFMKLSRAFKDTAKVLLMAKKKYQEMGQAEEFFQRQGEQQSTLLRCLVSLNSNVEEPVSKAFGCMYLIMY